MKPIIALLLISSICLGQTKKVNPNNTIDSIVSILERRINLSEIEKEKITELNSSLKNQLIIYQAKEDYFAAALSDQSTRFSLIISAIIAGLAFISFSWYKIEKMTINKKFNSFRKEFDSMKKENKLLEYKLLLTSGNALAMIAKDAHKNNAFIASFTFSLSASRDFHLSELLNEKYNEMYPITNLKNAIKRFNEISQNPENKQRLEKEKDSVYDDIKILSEADNQEIKDLVAEIRISLKNFLK